MHCIERNKSKLKTTSILSCTGYRAVETMAVLTQIGFTIYKVHDSISDVSMNVSTFLGKLTSLDLPRKEKVV